MRDLSLHILDLAQNSVRAQATCIQIEITEDLERNQFSIRIEDDGSGMEEALLERVENPFATTRTLRKVGLGIPFIKQMCEECEGKLTLKSEVGKGTILEATMVANHIDRLPLGDIAQTITTLIMAKPQIRFIYTHCYASQTFCFDTEVIKEMVEGVPIDNLEILEWIQAYIREQIELLKDCEE